MPTLFRFVNFVFCRHMKKDLPLDLTVMTMAYFYYFSMFCNLPQEKFFISHTICHAQIIDLSTGVVHSLHCDVLHSPGWFTVMIWIVSPLDPVKVAEP